MNVLIILIGLNGVWKKTLGKKLEENLVMI